jgi:hypothetical protein
VEFAAQSVKKMAPTNGDACSSRRLVRVQSDNVRYQNDYIEADYVYQSTKVEKQGDQIVVSIPAACAYTHSA